MKVLSRLVSVVLLALSMLLFAHPVRAASFTVTRTDDPTPDGCQPNDCSLREAVIAANTTAGADTINLPASIYTLSIGSKSPTDEDLSISGDLDLRDNVSIIGASGTIIQAGTNPTTSVGRVVHVVSGSATIDGVTIRYGNATYGGGILVDGTLVLNNSAIINNTAESGGGIAGNVISINNSTVQNNVGGGIASGGTVTVTNSIVSGNRAQFGVGGLFVDGTLTVTDSTIHDNQSSQGTGGISSLGSFTLTRSTVSDNQSTNGAGGIYNEGTMAVSNSTISGNSGKEGGGVQNAWELTLSNSTISNNTARNGGGIDNGGTATLTNSTISGNKALIDGGGIRNLGNATVANGTITNNVADADIEDGVAVSAAGQGGGIANMVKAASFRIRNTLIANNVTELLGVFTESDCFTQISLESRGYNLIKSTDGCEMRGDTSTNITGVDPQLGPLANNGGSTQTHALLAGRSNTRGSVAINAGNPAGCTDAEGQPLSTDQRGVTRPQGTRCDIGAFELEMQTPPPSPTPQPGQLAPRVFIPTVAK